MRSISVFFILLISLSIFSFLCILGLFVPLIRSMNVFLRVFSRHMVLIAAFYIFFIYKSALMTMNMILYGLTSILISQNKNASNKIFYRFNTSKHMVFIKIWFLLDDFSKNSLLFFFFFACCMMWVLNFGFQS